MIYIENIKSKVKLVWSISWEANLYNLQAKNREGCSPFSGCSLKTPRLDGLGRLLLKTRLN